MANLLNKDPVVCDEERRSFIEDLHRFHQSRGTPFDLIPKIGGREVDLHRLYRRVVELGGWRKVCNELQWEDLQTEFDVPPACPNGEQALKFIYVRYLYLYEKVNFLGEDPDQKDPESDSNPARKKANGPFYGVPLKYNYSQHQVPDLLRKNNGFSLDLISIGDYEKLEKALLSGLPNEVDFAINVCTLLSNEGRHVLRLDKSRHLLHLLLAHIGVFHKGQESLYDLYRNGWLSYTERDFLRFWYESVKDEAIKELITMNDEVYKRKEPVGCEVLHLGHETGVQSVEGQRVTQLAVLLRNLSFEDINQKLMASNAVVFKFLMLCVHSTYGTLKQLALDTLGNLAAQMVLDSIGNHRTKLILDFITKSFCADDKFTVVRALEILGKLCQVEKNEGCITDTLMSKTYEDVFSLLTVHDIQLIVHTLEALYQLSELGETTTTKIAEVRNAVDVLIDLITVEAQSYGPNSLNGIKVVEYVPAPSARKEEKEVSGDGTPSTTSNPTHLPTQTPPSTPAKMATPSKSAIRRPPQTEANDMEATTMSWFQATYEPRRSGKTSQIELFSEYLQFCHKFSLTNVLPSTDFLQLVKVAFPQSETKTMTRPNGDKDVCFWGFCKRANPKPFLINSAVPKSMSVSLNLPSGAQASNSSPLVPNTPTPTLRQRLMEPPRHPIHQPIVHSGSGTTPSKGSSTPSTPRPIAPKPVAKQLHMGSTIVINQGPRPPGQEASLAQSSPSVKRQKIVPKPQQTNQQFPSIHNALQGDSNVAVKTAALLLEQDPLQKCSDTNLIKSLLAKKLSQNMVGRQNPAPTSHTAQYSEVPVSSSDFVGSQVSFVSPVSNDTQQHNASTTNMIVTTSTSSPHVLESTTSVQPLSQSQVPSHPELASTDDVLSSPSHTKKRKNSTGSRPVSPKLVAKCQGSPLPSSPRALSPWSKNVELEVCGEVERAKDYVRKGSETTIEKVENKGLQSDTSSSNSPVAITHPSPICSAPKMSDTNPIASEKGLPQDKNYQHCANPNSENTSERTNGAENMVHSNDIEMVDTSISKNSQNGIVTSSRDSIDVGKCVKMNGNPNLSEEELTSDKTIIDTEISKDEPICKTQCNESNVVNSSNQKTKLLNGNIASPNSAYSDFPPSPICFNNIQSGLINGISDDSMDSISGEKSLTKSYPKEQVLKLVEKSSKVNGISNHIGNGDCVVEKMEIEQTDKDCGKLNNTICKESLKNHRELNGNGTMEVTSTVKSELRPKENGQLEKQILDPKDTSNLIGDTNVSPAAIKLQSAILGEKRVCDSTRHVPTPETSRDGELSSDSFASTVESLPDKHSAAISVNVAQPSTPTVSEKFSPSSIAGDKKPKSRKRSRSVVNAPTIPVQECKTVSAPVQVVDFMCEWAGCNRCFENAKSVFYHVVKTHTLVGTDGMCQWAQCQPIKRQRWSLITHLQDHHCSDNALRASSARRLQTPNQPPTPVIKKPAPPPPAAPPTPTPTPAAATTTSTPTTNSNGTLVYPNDAAMQAIKRFLVRPPFQEFMETREGPVTKHIRLTAALILRNIARYSPLGRRQIKRKEVQISYVTMSAVESSTALANCLWEIINHH